MKHQEVLSFISNGCTPATLKSGTDQAWSYGEASWITGQGGDHGAFWPKALPLADLPDFPLFLVVSGFEAQSIPIVNVSKCSAGQHYDFEVNP